MQRRTYIKFQIKIQSNKKFSYHSLVGSGAQGVKEMQIQLKQERRSTAIQMWIEEGKKKNTNISNPEVWTTRPDQVGGMDLLEWWL